MNRLLKVLYLDIPIKADGFDLIDSAAPWNMHTETYRCGKCGNEVRYNRVDVAYGRRLRCESCLQIGCIPHPTQKV